MVVLWKRGATAGSSCTFTVVGKSGWSIWFELLLCQLLLSGAKQNYHNVYTRANTCRVGVVSFIVSFLNLNSDVHIKYQTSKTNLTHFAFTEDGLI